MICDCYAVNVASDEDVWCYYYAEFPLVHLRSRVRASIGAWATEDDLHRLVTAL